MEILAGDIGGTKSWLAWASMTANGTHIRCEKIYASADFPSAEALLRQFSHEAQATTPADVVCLALPGPVQPGQPVRLTNLDWVLEQTQLQAALHTSQVLLLNDFQAAAYGIATLNADDYVALHVPTHPSPLAGEGLEMRGSRVATRVLTGVGTGLGLAWLQADSSGYYQPFATEGGHTDFAPANAQQQRLLTFMRERFAHVSWERVLSGPGVNQVWQFCWQDMTGEIPTELREHNGAVVNQLAQAGDPLAIAAMQLFADIYANWVGNIALLYQPFGGLYLAGGISARIQPWLQTPRFLAQCFAKGRMAGLVQQIPIYLITNTRLGLQGALAWARHHTLQ